MDIYRPYTYLIGWSKLGKWYYGVRFARGCNPSDLWTKYFTSSKHVKNFRKEHGEPDIIEVRKTFDTPERAIEWEDRVIVKMKLYIREDFLNANRSKGFMLDPEIIRRKNSCPLRAKKISESKTGKKLSDEHVAKTKAGVKLYWASLPPESRKKSNETKRKISESAKLNNPGFSATSTCPKCGKEGQKANISRHHGLSGERCRWGKVERNNQLYTL